MSLKDSLNFSDLLNEFHELSNSMNAIDDHGHVALSREDDEFYKIKGQKLKELIDELNKELEDIIDRFDELYSY